MGGKTSTSTSQVQIPPEVLARYNSVNATAQQVAQTPFQQYSTNPNAFVAPLTQSQQSGIANTNAAAGEAQPYYGAATGFALAGGQQVNPGALNTSAYMNPYLQTVLGSTAAQINQNNQQAMAGQTGNAIDQGYFGGDRSGIASAVLQGQQNLAAGQVYSGIASDAYQQALATAQQQQGVGLGAAQANRAATQQTGQTLAELGSGAQAAALSGAQAQLGAGQVEQQTEQAGKTALYNQFLQQQSYPFQTAQFLANIAEGTGALSGNTTTSTQPGSLFSDERLKEDMEPIGKGFDGANIYRFRYRGDPTTRIGMSAQEVERKHPEAVSEHGGFKAVDYGQATDDAAERGGFALAANDNDEPRRARAYGGGYSGTGGMAAPAGVNPYDIAMLLQAQEGMYAPYSQAGLYGGQASGAPHGGSSYVPQANLPIGHLSTAPAPTRQQPTPLQSAASLADTANKFSEFSKTDLGKAVGHGFSNAVQAGKNAWNTITPAPAVDTSHNEPVATDEASQYVPIDTSDTANIVQPEARGGFARAHRQYGGESDDPYAPQGPGLNIPTQGQAPQQLTPAKPPAQGPGGLTQALGAGANLATIGMGAAKLAPEIGAAAGGIGSWLGGLLPLLALQRGGRAGYADGGDTDDPYAAQGGLDIPDASPRVVPLDPAKPPSSSGGDSTMGDIMDIAKIASMFMANGGRIGRHGYALDGSVDGAPDDDSGIPAPLDLLASADQGAGVTQSIASAQDKLNQVRAQAAAQRSAAVPVLHTTNVPIAPTPPTQDWSGDPAVQGGRAAVSGVQGALGAAGDVARGVEAAKQSVARGAMQAGPAVAGALSDAERQHQAWLAQQYPSTRFISDQNPLIGDVYGHLVGQPGAGSHGPDATPGAAPAPVTAPPAAPTEHATVTAAKNAAGQVAATTKSPAARAGAGHVARAVTAAGAASPNLSLAPDLSGAGLPGPLPHDPLAQAPTQAGFAPVAQSIAATSAANAPGGGGFASAGDPNNPTPRVVQHEGEAPLPTTDAQGNPVTPGTVRHDLPGGFYGAGPAAGPGAAAAPHQGGFGGLLGNIVHGVEGGLGGLAHLAGYEGNGQWNMDRLIPILSGIGDWAAAPTRNPFTAAAMGLKGYGQAYMGQKQMEAGIANTQMQTFQEMQSQAPPGMMAQPGMGRDAAHTAYDEQGKPWRFVPKGSMIGKPGPPQAGVAGAPGSVPTAGGAGVPASATAPMGGGAAAAAPAGATGQPGIAPPPPQTGGAGAPHRGGMTADYDRGTYQAGPDDDTNDFLKQTYGGSEDVPGFDPSNDAYTNRALVMAHPGWAAEDAEDARQVAGRYGNPDLLDAQHRNLVTLAEAEAKVSPNGWMGVGNNYEDRVALAGVYNTLRTITGGQGDPAVTEQLSTADLMNKIRTFMGGQQAYNLGQHAFGATENFMGVLPGGGMQKAAANHILAQMMVGVQRQRDLYQFHNAYLGKYQMNLGVNNAFDKQFSPTRYNHEQASLERMLARGGKDNSIPSIFESLAGNPAGLRKFEQGYTKADGTQVAGWGEGQGRYTQ